MRICIDQGHGGKDPGAIGGGIYEKDINLDVAERLVGLLWTKHETIYTHGDDTTSSLFDRVSISNAWNSDLFISIHCNSADSTNAHGIETWHYSQPGLAQIFQDSLMAEFPDRTNRGIKKGNLYVLRHTICPAVLVELGFISNLEEREWLLKDNTKTLIAIALAKAINIWKLSST